MKKKFNLIFGALLASCSLLSIVGCKKNDANNDNKKDPTTEDPSTEEPVNPSNPSDEYQLNSFGLPRNLADFNSNKDQAGKDNENSFKNKDVTFVVGDDNPFIFKPAVSFTKKSDGSPVNINCKIKLEIFDDKNTKVGSDIYTFNEDDSSIQFSSAAIGNTYTLKALPKDYTKFEQTGKDIPAISFTLTVEDGYNCYNALDLGRMNLITENELEVQHGTTVSDQIFYDFWLNSLYDFVDKDKDFATKTTSYFELWKAFLQSKGQTNLVSTNGIFLQNNIEITKNDIPEDYFVYENEVIKNGINDQDEVKYLSGTLRDATAIYTKLLYKDFTLNGNLFTISSEKIPLQHNYAYRSGGDDDPLRIQLVKSTDPVNQLSSASLFTFIHNINKSPDDKTVTVKNLNSIGNLGYVTNPSNNVRAEEGAQTQMFFKNQYGMLKLENSIIKNYLIGFNSSADEGDKTLEVEDTRIYDCYSSGGYLYASDNNTMKNTEMKRFGAPVLLLNSLETKDDDPDRKCGHCGITCDASCTLENYVDGTEAWFRVNQANSIVSQITSTEGIEGILNSYNASMLKSVKTGTNKDGSDKMENKFNFIFLGLPDKDAKAECHTNFKYGTYAQLNSNGTQTSTTKYPQPTGTLGESDIKRNFSTELSLSAPYLHSLNTDNSLDIAGPFIPQTTLPAGTTIGGTTLDSDMTINAGIYRKGVFSKDSDNYYQPMTNTLTGDYLELFKTGIEGFGQLHCMIGLYAKNS